LRIAAKPLQTETWLLLIDCRKSSVHSMVRSHTA